MSVLTYRGISLAILDTRAVHREAVYDGPTYLYTRWFFDVRAAYNPGATSYDANLNAPNTLAQGLYGAQTDVNVRHTLMQPRGQLAYKVGSVTVLSVPFGGGVCDANNGPNPIDCSVVQVTGDRTLLVDFQIETWVNECAPQSAGSGKVVLSHRWAATETMTRQGQYLATREIRGRVICRAETMRAQTAAPDDFRAALFFPVYQNMQREIIDVTAEEDGLAASYAVVDRERQFNLIAQVNGLVDLEISHTASIDRLGMEDWALNVGHSVVRGGRSVAAAISRGQVAAGPAGVELPIGAAIGTGLAGFGAALDVALTVARMVPRVTHTVVVRAWGNRNAFRPQLRKLATGIALSRAAIVNSPLATASFSATDLEHDEFVEVALRVKAGILQTIMADPAVMTNFVAGNVVGLGGAVVGQQFALNTSLLPDSEEIKNVFTKNVNPNPLPSSPGADASRGTHFGRLVAQALQAACALPAAPPGYQQALTTNLG